MSYTKLGVNNNSSDYIINQVTDLGQLKSVGIKKIRLLIIAYNADPTDWRSAGTYARNQGFYTIYGMSASPNILTSSSWGSYAGSVINEATYCQAHGVCDEFQIGNEEENHIDGITLTSAQLYTNMVNLAGSVKNVYTGNVSYSYDANNPGSWLVNSGSINANTNFDKIGANIYGGWNNRTDFINKISIHSGSYSVKGFISEFGLDPVWSNVPINQQQQADELQARMPYIESSGMDSYFYQWRQNNDDFAIKRHDNSFRLMYFSLLDLSIIRSMKDPSIPQFVLNPETQIDITINEPQRNDTPSFTVNPETKITLQIPQTDAQLTDQGYTYNQAGLTYNNVGVIYGGVYLANQDLAPSFTDNTAGNTPPTIKSIIEI